MVEKHHFYFIFRIICCSLLFWNAAWANVPDDVPSKKATRTENEEKSQKRFNSKDPQKGFEGEDEEGNYYYESVDNNSEVNVDENTKIVAKPENYDKGLKSVLSDGSYLFEAEESDQTGAFALRAGAMVPPHIVNSEGTEFVEIYSDKPLNVVFLDYSWQVQKFGKWGLTIGSGVGQTTAPGRFRSNPDELALEKYTIYMLPNHLSFSYRFQYTKEPYIAPYISGGVCAFAFAEKRDDNRKIKGIIAKGAQVAGGLKFNIGLLDPHGAFSLDSEYGINNVWLDIEYKVVKGMQKDRDISANVINAGVSFDF